MIVNNKTYQTIWMEGTSVKMIDQNRLPFEFEIHESKTYQETCEAICNMTVRGAGAIGAAAAYAMVQAFMSISSDAIDFIERAREKIKSTRPTAQNLFYAVDRVYAAGKISPEQAKIEALKITVKDIEDCQTIGAYGDELIRDGFRILTHCNAGWLAFVDYGSALAPIHIAHRKGKNIFVYVDETRPRGQGARLTAWELQQAGVPFTVIADNAGASLMQAGKIDMIIVGADRIARNGDVANKIGTLDRAILANVFKIPFYVAAPSSTFDLNCRKGTAIVIEERSEDEVLFQEGIDRNGNKVRIRVCAPEATAYNPAFDVTPAKYISGIITEKGIIKANEKSIKAFLKEQKAQS
ncbi:MAG: S-methyl-5-thioribose-1-phosphate isomerase [Lentimicrobiaceae bacterium]|jgi:S-methyl-5-thioribose-1-phosphate isomerase|nr:S-methyl-5-thioribose-1-phosphate isomerase [Lentimicrobiaceae bacterium]